MSSRKPITQHFRDGRERHQPTAAIRFKRHKTWLEYSWNEYYRAGEAAGLGLLALGVKKGDRVAIIANTRWEWAALDFGILGIGAVTVPIYQTNRPDEIEFVLKQARPKILVIEDQTQWRKWETVAKQCPFVERVIAIQPFSEPPPTLLQWDDFMELGLTRYPEDHFASLCAQTELTDLATIIFTSGTTGEPKGAMLTHEQILSEVEDLVRAFPISPADSTLTFLPYAHVLGRVELWLHTYLGFTMTFAESIEKLRSNLEEARPTVLIGVPRIFEKIYAGLMAQIEGHSWRKSLFTALTGHRDPLRRMLADRLVYAKIRAGLGGRLRFTVSGGSALDANLARFFHGAGVLILEGYGLTETTAAVAVNTPQAFEFGTVGKPLKDVEIKLAEDGEILVKSKKVMRGYYLDDESTKAATCGDYFRTGDIGEWTAKGFLRITDRKKDLIKTSGGKYVAPQKIEGLLKNDPMISHALIHGDRKKYVVALLTLNEPYAKAMARERGWSFRDFRALTQLPEVKEALRRSVAQVNSQLASFETIKNFAILPEDFSIERGELTPSLKVKRKVCDERYRDILEELY
ncbi:MAG TPA: long-chain fatty acid--CoA ligase [Bdellovibrionales bacterium]|nr:long-chain fatty acid--CoA ligase [Bdellovibrionales bacterium]